MTIKNVSWGTKPPLVENLGSRQVEVSWHSWESRSSRFGDMTESSLTKNGGENIDSVLELESTELGK